MYAVSHLLFMGLPARSIRITNMTTIAFILSSARLRHALIIVGMLLLLPLAMAAGKAEKAAQNGAKAASADFERIRKNLGERIPQLRGIEEVSATPMKGLYEVRIGTDVFYTDGTGSFVIQGELFDAVAKRNITEDRLRALTAVDFSKLRFDDAFKLVRGDGSRQIAVFEDPNCGYCKRFERDMLELDNITVHVFLYPILSPDSFEKSRDIWCAADRAGAWSNWMLQEKRPATSHCADYEALQRNLAFGRKHKITGTPTILFEDGSRVPGAVPHEQVEQKLAELRAAR